ncbi:MAG: protein kinase [Planctomycetes bacterium]|nr:protein kinase [Planctomycetota bacterium]
MRLTVETGPLAGTVVSLDREHPAVLGSAPDCTIRVQEAGVQPQQAVVKALKDQGFGIKALAAGVRVNGAAIEASPLNDGDIIEIGTTRIAFGQVQKRGLPTIPGYRILEELGRGGMGMVYRAEQVSLHREVALKVLSDALTKDPQFTARFVAEARAAAKLQHPNVVQVFDVEHDGGKYHFAMELMQEGSLEDWLKQNGVMPQDHALRVVADAAAGLAYAESLGIVHRDIKPDNLMLDQHGAVKIADLGLAGTGNETEEKAIGTPHFMAPEQVLRKEIDHRTDLYALGCTFYRLVTGRTPFRGQTVKDILRAQVKDEAEPAHKVNNKVSAEVSAIIQKLMAKEPKDRFQTANDLLEQVQVLLQPPAKKGLWIALAAAGVLVAGGAIYWAVNKPKDIETRTEYLNNPEAARLAKENEELKKAAREDAATIAMLTARAAGLPEGELAAALDRVAEAHQGTRAAAEAQQRAARLRQDLAERGRKEQERKRQVEEYLGNLGRTIEPQLRAGDFVQARQAIEAAPPAALKEDPELLAGLAQLEQQVLTAARDRLASFRKAVEAARDSKDGEALAIATDALAEAIGNKARWPQAMHDEVEAEKKTVAAGRDALAALLREQRDTLWQRYHDALVAQGGILAQLRAQDYAAAAAAALAFAATASGDQAGTDATNLAAAAQQANLFVEALDHAVAAGNVGYRGGDGTAYNVVRWDRKAQQLVVVDPQRKPAKEQTLSAAAFGPEIWANLAEQVESPPAGSRVCFLGFQTLAAHGEAARSYLARVQEQDDASGTGAGAYPLGSNLFDQLVRRLPEDDKLAWVSCMRKELLAGQRLAAGLRALSERRNLAAAGHLDKLLAESPHSFVVLLLR